MAAHKRMLLIDDDPTMVHMFENFLVGEPWEFFYATSGEEGIKKAGELKPDVIVLDVQLSDTLGFDVCRQLRTHSQLRSIPVLMLSGTYRDMPDKIKGLEGGADDYMIKPFDFLELMSRVDSLLRAYKSTRE